MAIKASGSISFSDIANEFGNPPNRNLGAYRVSQTVGELVDLPLDTGIPQSGIVSFSTFYSKKLNVVVNCGSGTRINARTYYDDATVGIVTTIGGYRIRPALSSGSKVWIHVSGTITPNSAAGQLYCALLTGNWDSNTDLILDIGPSGFVRGYGGNGGTGGASTNGSSGSPGSTGTSAIGITYTPISIRNRGTVFPGTGGGGGGGGGVRGVSAPLYARGGGGGGGAPFGSGGPRGSGEGPGTFATDGSPAGLFTQGPGGSGGFADGFSAGANPVYRTISGGPGGPGGSPGGGASIGGDTNNVTASLGGGGSAGPSGFAFVISGSSTDVTTSGPVGAIYNTNPS